MEPSKKGSNILPSCHRVILIIYALIQHLKIIVKFIHFGVCRIYTVGFSSMRSLE